MKKHVKTILLVLWMLMIFYMSSQTGSESSSTSNVVTYVILRIMNVFFPDQIGSDMTLMVERFAQPIRKLAHFSEYLILGVLMISNVRERRKDKILFLSVLFCVLYAVSDEIHQLFVINRYCSIWDMLLDSSGAITGIILYHLLAR